MNIFLERQNNLLYPVLLHFGFNIIYVFLDADIGVFYDFNCSLPDHHTDCRMDKQQLFEKRYIGNLLNYSERKLENEYS